MVDSGQGKPILEVPQVSQVALVIVPPMEYIVPTLTKGTILLTSLCIGPAEAAGEQNMEKGKWL